MGQVRVFCLETVGVFVATSIMTAVSGCPGTHASFRYSSITAAIGVLHTRAGFLKSDWIV